MIQKRVVLILGAGASQPYGFRLGSGLVEWIQGLGPGNAHYNFLLSNKFSTEAEFMAFKSDLLLSARGSIDSFLENNPKYMRIGKATIALLLGSGETIGNLYRRSEQTWYQYLFELIVNESEEGLFDPSRLSIVTYNYDRSLEFFFFNAIQRLSPDIDEGRAVEILKGLKIIHVHGLLDEPRYTQEISGRSYKPIEDAKELERCVNSIQLISEYAKDKGRYPEIHGLFADANSIVFLGFGYHATNLERLDLREKNTNRAMIYGTRYGLTDSEVRYNIEKIVAGKKLLTKELSKDFLRNHLEMFYAEYE